MRFIWTFILSTFSFSTLLAQKTEFKKVEFCYFRIDSASKARAPFVYAIIDSAGNINIKYTDESWEKTTFFTYKLNSSEIKRVNTVFNSNKKLSSFFVTKTLEKNEQYCGDYEFFLVEYKNQTKDSVCTIETFMSKTYIEMKLIIKRVSFFQESKNKKIKPFVIPKEFTKSFYDKYKKSKFLPKKCKLPFFGGN